MKLARPDAFHPRIVLAGSPRLPEGDPDDAGLVAALRKRGLHAQWRSWDDPEARDADLVIVRATADYRDRLAAFLAWTQRVPNLLNNRDVIAWNADEHYLRDLDWAGVPTLAARRGAAHPQATALVFLGGAPSHAFSSTAKIAVDEPDFELWEVGHGALRAVAARFGIRPAELLYARADVVGDAGEVRLTSLDLVAPTLGWGSLDPGTRELQQREFALAVEAALDRLGLDPFSHRRP
ncbi:hypothetical protein ACAG26_18270 [Mycobacterium sp. pUA109]|uniref:hypothetical protein n=1 Tax=Mycobacterium sp. pUA109 TaxID=3238982 RepID=UPI00351AF05A